MTKAKRITSLVLMALPGLVLVIGGVMKVANAEPEMVMQFLTRAGYGSCIKALGLSEIIIAALLFYPKTNKTGFLLATAYFGGALSLEIGGGQFPSSVLFLALLWTGMFIKDKGMFLPSATA